ncbi:MAG: hypothetical protein K1X57_10895 [Gemmataceae bacterium]|nr:hypothetical protein [Gemmataceae bacterium]
MAHNGAKATHTLAEKMLGSLFSEMVYGESACPIVTYNGSKLSLVIMPVNGEKARAKLSAESRHKEVGTPDTNSGHGKGSPDTNSGHGEGAPDAAGRVPPENLEDDPALLAIAEPARKRQQLSPDVMRPIIRSLCRGRFLPLKHLASLLKREPNSLQRWTLRPMAQERQLVMAIPDTPNHPKQAYKTNPDWSAK